jgi:hypothetical protein
MAYLRALSQHLPGMTSKYGTYIVTLFLQSLSFVSLSLCSQSVQFFFNILARSNTFLCQIDTSSFHVFPVLSVQPGVLLYVQLPLLVLLACSNVDPTLD